MSNESYERNICSIKSIFQNFWQALLLVFLLASHPILAVPNRAYVTNYNDGTISVIDTLTNGIVTTIVLPMGSNPIGIAFTPDGTRAYVSRGDATNQLDVFDTATNTLLTTISPCFLPHAIAMSSDGNTAYVVNNTLSNIVSVIDTNQNIVMSNISFPPLTFLEDIAIAPTSNKVYVTSLDSVWVIENNMLMGTIPIPMGSSLTGITWSPDGTRAYVADNGNQTVLVIDAVNNLYLSSIPLPMGSNPNFLAVTPDNAHLFVTNSNSTVAVIDTATNMIDTLILIPTTYPWAIAITPDGLNAYLTDISSNNAVWNINTITKAVTGPIAIGNDPEDIAITPAAPTPPPPPPSPAAPTNLTGRQQTGANSGLEKEFVNILNWTANPNTTDIAGYIVARNGNVIATLNASTFQYTDHNQKKGASVSYSVTSFTFDGGQSAPISIIIN